jgi:hypothetical protein
MINYLGFHCAIERDIDSKSKEGGGEEREMREGEGGRE